MTDILKRIQAEQHRQTAGVREILLEKGRPDLVEELDRRMWDIETGVDGARGTWSALTEPQCRVMLALDEGRALVRCPFSRTTYEAYSVGRDGPDAIRKICTLSTVNNLFRRKLIESDNPSDPMKRLVLSSYGRFVMKRGRAPQPVHHTKEHAHD